MFCMRSLATLAAVPCLFFASSARADDPVPNAPELVKVGGIFVPVGFDNNDEVVAVVDGYLPNTCYKLAFNEAKLDPATNVFTITQWARHRTTGVCIDVLVPFTSEVALGVTAPGTYQIASDGADAQPLVVNPAPTESPDNFLYAPVDAVHIEYDQALNTYVAVLQGRFTSSCMSWTDVRVIDSGRTLQILPIIALSLDDGSCSANEVDFVKRVPLPGGITPGRHLVHVRSLNGKSANAVFSVMPGR